jgi:hypothetical protein
VNVSSYDGTCSRSNRESGASVVVGEAAFDSKRTVQGIRVRDSMGEGLMAADVRGVWKRRFAGAGMRSAWAIRAVRGAVLRAIPRNKDVE